MKLEPTRRSFIAGMGAAAAMSRFPATAMARDNAGGPSYRTATELVKALADRQVSARELVDAAIARIEALDPKTQRRRGARFRSGARGRRRRRRGLARGERRPLLGLPMTVKEQFDVAGLPTTWGYPKFKDWQPEVDALAVQRLKAAGAIVLGKTNVPMGLTDWQSYNEVYGTTNNPWDLVPHSRRVVRRLGGGARRRLRAAGTRLGYRRLAAGAGAFLRRLRPQAEPRPRPAARLRSRRRPRRSRSAATSP